MFKTDITYISENSNMRSYSAKCIRGKIEVSKPSRCKQQPKTIEIEYSKQLKGHPSKFVRLKMDEPVARKLIEVLEPMLEDDSTKKMEEQLVLKKDGENVTVEIQ